MSFTIIKVPATGKLTVYMTTQAPHIIRAAVALVAELPEHQIRVISPDLGGGFGNKVPVYPGYVISILASILTEKPVKSQFGYHIIRLDDIREAKTPTMAELKPQLIEMMNQDQNWQRSKFNEMIAKLKAKAKIQ